jgi:RNA 2',3'-cyclic 3'-phosphodiesterase
MRLFFALWPEDRVRLGLAPQRLECARLTAGRPTLPVTLHLTLAFLGNVSEGRLAELKMLAEKIRVSPFDFEINQAGCFASAGVAWLASQTPPKGLFKLHQKLQAAIVDAGFEVDTRTFRPHITVARNVAHPFETHEIPLVSWPIRQFSLVSAQRNDHGVEYHVLENFPLIAPDRS